MSAWEWHYVSNRARYVHARRRRSVGLAWVAQCGIAPSWFRDWLGTGSQDECERAAALPRCPKCLAKGAS